MNYDSKKIAALSLVALVFARWTYSASPQVEHPRTMLFAVWPGQKGKQPASPILAKNPKGCAFRSRRNTSPLDRNTLS